MSPSSGAPLDYVNTPYAPVVTQTAPLTLTVGTAGATGADAFWLHDDDGELVAFSAAAQQLVSFDISAVQPLVVTAFVHYADSCIIAETNMTLTWDGEIDAYFRRNYDNYGVSTWPPAAIAASMPNVTVDYAARTANVTVTFVRAA